MNSPPHCLCGRALRVGAGFLACLAFEASAATGTVRDVQHVVILTMENRSFDHYYGSLAGVRGFNDRNALVFPNGSNVFAQPQGSGYVWPILCNTQCVADVAHDWNSGQLAVNHGKWDLWVAAKSFTTMPYFTRTELPFDYALAEAYTICDAYYCGVVGPTNPNRLYELTGTIDPQGLGGGPVTNNYVPPGGFTWITYPERLQSSGISWKVYQEDSWGGNPLIFFAQYSQSKPGSPLYDRGMALVTNIVTAFRADISNGTLPQVSWLAPNWWFSEHPALSPSAGAVLLRQLLEAVAANPAVYASTVFFITYDENGGFFDHVPCPLPPPGTPGEFVGGLPIGLGVRVPMLIVSPWTRGGFVCSQVFDHSSILRFLEAWTGVHEPNISGWRRRVCGDLTSAFDFAHPDTSIPSLPPVNPISCGTAVVVPVPAPQIFPAQEQGSRPARNLPYQPNVNGAVECPSGALWLEMTNAGCASVHFSIYANAYRTDGPWQYDVAPNGAQPAYFATLPNTGGLYDFTCYGPNGFQRRFAGRSQTNCSLLEVASTIDPSLGIVSLRMNNATDSSATFSISNAYSVSSPQIYTVPSRQAMTDTFLVSTQGGWYDLTATVDIDSAFLRRLAGHIEPLSAYNLQPGPPLLSISLLGPSLVLSYPAVPGVYVLESRPDLSSGSWALTIPASSNKVCGSTVLTLPVPAAPAYFRLRQ